MAELERTPGKAEKVFVAGMTLKPGESATLPVDLSPLGPDLCELIHRGAVEVKAVQGPIEETAPGRYRREVQIVIAGRAYAKMELAWQAKPRFLAKAMEKVKTWLGRR